MEDHRAGGQCHGLWYQTAWLESYLRPGAYPCLSGASPGGGAGGCFELGNQVGQLLHSWTALEGVSGMLPLQWYPAVQCLLISVLQILPPWLIFKPPMQSHWTHKTPEDLNLAQPFGYKEEPEAQRQNSLRSISGIAGLCCQTV